MSDWPFAEPENLATITVRQIIVDGDPILRVSHDEDDGGWQFLTGGQVEMKDAMLVGLGEIVALDPSVIELADLPLGWRATRENQDSPWQREPQ
jgi:hypothetical protein